MRGQTADFFWQIAKGPRSLNKLSHGCFVLLKLFEPPGRFPLLMFLTIHTRLKLVVGNAVDFLLPLWFLVGSGNFWTPIIGTWQTFLPRSRTLFAWVYLFRFLADCANWSSHAWSRFHCSTFCSACCYHSVWVCLVANLSCWMGLLSIKSGVWIHWKYLQRDFDVAGAPQVKKTLFRFLVVLLSRILRISEQWHFKCPHLACTSGWMLSFKAW